MKLRNRVQQGVVRPHHQAEANRRHRGRVGLTCLLMSMASVPLAQAGSADAASRTAAPADARLLQAGSQTTTAVLPQRGASLAMPVLSMPGRQMTPLILDEMWVLAERSYRQGDDEQALPLLMGLVLRDPHRTEAWLRIGNIHQRGGRMGAALDAYRQLQAAGAEQVDEGASRSSVTGKGETRVGHQARHEGGGTARNGRKLVAERKAARHAGAAGRSAPESLQADAVRLKAMFNLGALSLAQGHEALRQIEKLQQDPAIWQAAGIDAQTAALMLGQLQAQSRQIQQLLGLPESRPAPGAGVPGVTAPGVAVPGVAASGVAASGVVASDILPQAGRRPSVRPGAAFAAGSPSGGGRVASGAFAARASIAPVIEYRIKPGHASVHPAVRKALPSSTATGIVVASKSAVGPGFSTQVDDRAPAVVSMARHVDRVAASAGDVRKAAAGDGRERHAGDGKEPPATGDVRKVPAGEEREAYAAGAMTVSVGNVGKAPAGEGRETHAAGVMTVSVGDGKEALAGDVRKAPAGDGKDAPVGDGGTMAAAITNVTEGRAPAAGKPAGSSGSFGSPDSPNSPDSSGNFGRSGGTDSVGSMGSMVSTGSSGTPGNPGNLSNLSNPGNPGNSGNSGNSGNPSNPSNPSNPVNPGSRQGLALPETQMPSDLRVVEAEHDDGP